MDGSEDVEGSLGERSIRGDVFDPPTLHKYLYAASDPANKADPSGREYTIGGLMTAMAIGATVFAIFNYAPRREVSDRRPTPERRACLWEPASI